MAGRGRKNADARIVTALAAGETAEAAARQAGVSERTIYRRLNDAAFRRRVEQERTFMLERVVQRLSAIGRAAVDKLGQLMNSKKVPPSVQLGAARAVLDQMFCGNELVLLSRQIEDLRAEIEEIPTHANRKPETPDGSVES